jgi:uncharacterized protein YjbI with pentapeptide repeats
MPGNSKSFEHMSLASANFNDVNLRAANFDNVCLADSRFNNIDLSSAQFSGINLRNVSIKYAAMDGMAIDGVLVTELFAAYEQLNPGKHKHC